MIVTLDDGVFAGGAEHLELCNIFRFGLLERHYIKTAPPFEATGDRHVNRWLRAQSRSLREEVERALANSTDALAHGPTPRPKVMIRIAAISAPDWTLPIPVLPVSVACRLLDMPLRLLLENRRNDGNFLRAMAPPHLRKRFTACEDSGWIERVHGGGLEEMLHRIEEDAKTPMDRLRLWVMYDSDARRRFDPDNPEAAAPWGPATTSIAVGKACDSAGIHAHRLWRRAMENYLPAEVLHAWAWNNDKRRKIREKRAKKVRTFLAMSPEQRHYFNMKEGITGDEGSGRGVSPIYSSEEKNNQDLQTGFGTDLAGYLDENDEQYLEIQQEWLKDGQMVELLRVIKTIFERM